MKPSKAQIPILYRMCAVSRRAYNWKLAEQTKAYELAKANTPEGEKVKQVFPHYLDCEAHLDVFHEIYQTWHKRRTDGAAEV